MSILLIGGSGRLGTALQRQWQREGRTFNAPSSQELNVLHAPDLARFFAEQAPAFVIYAAAHTAVDKAEHEERALAYAMNAQAPETLAILCAQRGIPLLFLSTDYVFGGDRHGYREDDPPSPINVYGASKAEGERRVRLHHPASAFIVRTSRLFGLPGTSKQAKRSFLDLILADAEQAAVVPVNPQEEAVPTLVDDLAAHLTRHFLDEPAREPGIYHLSNGGDPVSWNGWAQSFVEMAGLPVTITPRDLSTLKRAARRPAHLQLLNAKLPPLRPWREAQQAFFQEHPLSFNPVWRP